MKKLIYIALLLQLLVSTAWAQVFVIKNIEIQGLKRIPAATVESYLPVKRGDILHEGKTGEILRSLYQTGFFEHITLAEKNDTLIIRVVERPTIGQLKVAGNSIIPTDKLKEVMKSLGITEGRAYNKALLEKISQSLLNQYYMVGRYNARVDIKTSPMPRNRIKVTIDISEGVVAKVERISIIGNKAFTEKTLLSEMELKKHNLWSYLMQSDRYSEQKMEESLEKLRSFYMDRGYLRFNVKSSQAQITPNRKAVYLTIVIEEGEPYTVEGYKIKGKTVLPREEIEKEIHLNPGDTFSRKKVMEAQKQITRHLGDHGYLFAVVSVLPELDDKQHKVFLTFTIKQGKPIYVRKVTFTNNTRTNDVVLRREVEQMEAAAASTTKMEESKHRLNLLPYIKDTELSVSKVPGIDDQIDVDYKVKEDSSAQATFKVGYSQTYRTILGAGLNQKNFLGTGNTLGLNLQQSRLEQTYSIDYTDPYYTIDGISRTFNFSIFRVDPGASSNVNSGYITNEYNLGMQFGVPIGQEQGIYSRFITGLTYQDTLIHVINNKVSAQVLAFVNNHGRHYRELDFKLGYSRNSFDRAIFPTRGVFQSLFFDIFLPVSKDSVSFYMGNYSGKWYLPLTDEFIILTRGDFAYGNGFHGVKDFPFFRNFYAGGIGSVRGYQGYTLGPRDSQGLAYGGNMMIDASVSLIFPNHISDNLRTSVFVDAGNVYTSLNNRGFGGQSTDAGPVRFSTGIEADLMTPFGPIALSLAKRINPDRNDDAEVFQFALGANF